MTTIVKTALPDSSQSDEIKELVRACRLHDRTTLSFPLEQDMICFLAYEETRLCAVLSLLPFDEELWEGRAFTLPGFRRRGLFSMLLDEALLLAPQICFPADPGCADTAAVLKSMEAEFWYSEHMMERVLSEDQAVGFPSGVTLDFRRFPDTEAYACTARENGQVCGTFALYPHGSSAYLCELLVPETLRGQGCGTRLMRELFRVLAKRQVPSVSLQVSGDNEAALALYKKTGFRITETLSYYLF